MAQEPVVVTTSQAFLHALAHEFGDVTVISNDGSSQKMSANMLSNGVQIRDLNEALTWIRELRQSEQCSCASDVINAVKQQSITEDQLAFKIDG
ncbi:MAG: hypothetical protein ACPG05_04845 [Bdellovibrionales bacterium]